MIYNVSLKWSNWISLIRSANITWEKLYEHVTFTLQPFYHVKYGRAQLLFEPLNRLILLACLLSIFIIIFTSIYIIKPYDPKTVSDETNNWNKLEQLATLEGLPVG